MPVIAIDGPAGSGKSTVARAVARRLELDHLDTGAMYRAVALAALRRGVEAGDGPALSRLARRLEIDVGERVRVDGEDATEAIRGDDVTGVVSAVASHRRVRAEMVRRQREWVESRDGGGVVEGRDIGTVVFPAANLKVFLTASGEERARRRAAEAGADPATVGRDITRRDELDSGRAASPLAVARDAVVIDTTGRGVDDIVDEILSRL